jgi:5-hydroxyisourate hydrolase-like protein (transthyretin family)
MNNLSRAPLLSLLTIFFLTLTGCSTSSPTASPEAKAELEAISRTEFTDRVENYFEYEPLHSGKPSQVRIHLTDLSDGSPVEKAQVSLLVRTKGGSGNVVETTARVGKVTGIYVADLNIPRSGQYDIEFRIKNQKLDERLSLSDFKVE